MRFDLLGRSGAFRRRGGMAVSTRRTAPNRAPCCVAVLLVSVLAGSARAQQDVLTNEDIVVMTASGLADELIIGLIEVAEVAFDLSETGTTVTVGGRRQRRRSDRDAGPDFGAARIPGARRTARAGGRCGRGHGRARGLAARSVSPAIRLVLQRLQHRRTLTLAGRPSVVVRGPDAGNGSRRLAGSRWRLEWRR